MSTITSPNIQGSRALRADAQRNCRALLEAADAELTAHGANASLEAIAKRAGVGIGTLYRHFPTRDDLIAKVLEASNTAVIERGRELLASATPALALREWLSVLVEQMTTYRGLTGALANSYVAKSETQLCSSCELITGVGEQLLARAQAAREIRSDAEVREVILSAHAASWIAEQTCDPSAVDRLLGILFDGLRVIAAKPPARAKRRAR